MKRFYQLAVITLFILRLLQGFLPDAAVLKTITAVGIVFFTIVACRSGLINSAISLIGLTLVMVTRFVIHCFDIHWATSPIFASICFLGLLLGCHIWVMATLRTTFDSAGEAFEKQIYGRAMNLGLQKQKKPHCEVVGGFLFNKYFSYISIGYKNHKK